MTKIIRKEHEQIYTNPGNVYEAFCDILKLTGRGPFENIHYDEYAGTIEYDVYDRHIIKVFDNDQATPEKAADLIQWAFSMLDCIANS